MPEGLRHLSFCSSQKHLGQSLSNPRDEGDNLYVIKHQEKPTIKTLTKIKKERKRKK
jgi:hypothetical protein